MKSTNLDPRQRRTRERLRTALMELLREMEYDNIQIEHIRARADITISTFYRHYANKIELLQDMIGLFFEQMEPLLAHLNLNMADLLDLNQEPPLLVVARIVEADRLLFQRLFRTPYQAHLLTLVMRLAIGKIQKDTPNWKQHEVEFISGCAVGYFVQWILLDLPYNAEEVARIIHWTTICGLMTLRGEMASVTLPTPPTLPSIS